MFFLLRGNLSISCKNVAIRKGRRQYWHLKSTTTILCLLYMAVTWSLCLAFLVLEKISVVIAFAVLNFFQGPLVIPFLSFVGIQLQRKIDSQTKIALRESAIAALNQQPIKVCLHQGFRYGLLCRKFKQFYQSHHFLKRKKERRRK